MQKIENVSQFDVQAQPCYGNIISAYYTHIYMYKYFVETKLRKKNRTWDETKLNPVRNHHPKTLFSHYACLHPDCERATPI